MASLFSLRQGPVKGKATAIHLWAIMAQSLISDSDGSKHADRVSDHLIVDDVVSAVRIAPILTRIPLHPGVRASRT